MLIHFISFPDASALYFKNTGRFAVFGKERDMKRKIFCLGLCLTMLFSVGGCSSIHDRIRQTMDHAVMDMANLVRRISGEDNRDVQEPNLPDVDLNSWELRLVNKWSPIPREDDPETGLTKDQYLFDVRALEALDGFLVAGEREGLDLCLSSAWRSYTYQEELFKNKVRTLMEELGCDWTAAEEDAARAVARPGESEHQLGLAADIVSYSYNVMDGGFGETEAGQWLQEHCAEYGFILRYPADKEDVTGVIYEPWHFRYVGTEAAVYIMEHGLCLEEFRALYE